MCVQGTCFVLYEILTTNSTVVNYPTLATKSPRVFSVGSHNGKYLFFSCVNALQKWGQFQQDTVSVVEISCLVCVVWRCNKYSPRGGSLTLLAFLHCKNYLTQWDILHLLDIVSGSACKWRGSNVLVKGIVRFSVKHSHSRFSFKLFTYDVWSKNSFIMVVHENFCLRHKILTGLKKQFTGNHYKTILDLSE